MKLSLAITGWIVFGLLLNNLSAQTSQAVVQVAHETPQNSHKPMDTHLYLDVHHLGVGHVDFAGAAEAHAKDLVVQKKYGVHFIKFWVDEAKGDVYCLASAPDTQSVLNTHAEAHGLMPSQVFLVKGGVESALNSQKNFYLDFHELGAGKVSAKDVAGAHKRDLEVEKKYNVNFLNYWVNEQEGLVICLSQAPDSSAIIKTHKEAHGLIPVRIEQVKQGQ